MYSVGSDQHAWQRSYWHAGVLLDFCIFAVLLLVMLCCCQLRRLGLDFVNIHISGSNLVYERVKLASGEDILNYCFCAFKISHL